MNKKYERYIDYIVNDIEAPYFDNMKEMYGLRPDEYELVLSKLFNQPVSITDSGDYVYNNSNGKNIYYEFNKYWEKYEYNSNGKLIYFKDSDGDWIKKEYDINGNLIYSETSDGYWYKNEWDSNGNLIYTEDSDGHIEDNR
jgi:YD repeat-containing protein